MATAFRISDGATNYDFDESFLVEMEFVKFQDVDRHQTPAGYFCQSKKGMVERSLKIKLWKKNSVARDLVESIYGLIDSYGQPKTLLCYYEYLINTSNVFEVQFKRDDYVEAYITGESSGGDVVDILFTEAWSTGVTADMMDVSV